MKIRFNKLLAPSQLLNFLLKKYNNYQKLQKELEKIGKEYELKSYGELLQPAEQTFIIKEINGDKLMFSGEAYQIKSDGTLCFCIDADGLPTWWGIKPSYHFYKRRDGSIYY